MVKDAGERKIEEKYAALHRQLDEDLKKETEEHRLKKKRGSKKSQESLHPSEPRETRSHTKARQLVPTDSIVPKPGVQITGDFETNHGNNRNDEGEASSSGSSSFQTTSENSRKSSETLRESKPENNNDQEIETSDHVLNFMQQKQKITEHNDTLSILVNEFSDLSCKKDADFRSGWTAIMEKVLNVLVKQGDTMMDFISTTENQFNQVLSMTRDYEHKFPKMQKDMRSYANKLKSVTAKPNMNKEKAIDAAAEIIANDEEKDIDKQITITGLQENAAGKSDEDYRKEEIEKATRTLVEVSDEAEKHWEDPECMSVPYIRKARVTRPKGDINKVIVRTNRINPDQPGRHGINEGTEKTFKRRLRDDTGTISFEEYEPKRYRKVNVTLVDGAWTRYIIACQLCIIQVANRKQSETGSPSDFKKRKIHVRYGVHARKEAEIMYRNGQKDEKRRVRNKVRKERELAAGVITEDQFKEFMDDKNESPAWVIRVMPERIRHGIWWPTQVTTKFKEGKSQRLIRDKEEARYKKQLDEQEKARSARGQNTQ